MRMPKVKICGITRAEEVAALNEIGADYAGFVFAESVRRIGPSRAAELARLLNDNIGRCGVFVESSVDEINAVTRKVGLTIAQLHGGYSEEEIAAIEIPVWAVINIKDSSSAERAEHLQRTANVSGIVVDTYVKGSQGGTGKPFNWELIKGFHRQKTLILAGGLNAENVQQAIWAVKPDVVDVSSGVEVFSEDGRHKSSEKIRIFLERIAMA